VDEELLRILGLCPPLFRLRAVELLSTANGGIQPVLGGYDHPFSATVVDKVSVHNQPEFKLSAAYFLEYFKYVLSREIATNGHTVALVKFCIIMRYCSFSKIFSASSQFIFYRPSAPAPCRISAPIFTPGCSPCRFLLFKRKKGDIISRVTEDVKEVEISIISFLEVTVREPLNIIIVLGALLLLSPQLTALCICHVADPRFYNRAGR